MRGIGYEAEWASNVTLASSTFMLNRGKEARGFADAADKVITEVKYYLQKNNLEDEQTSSSPALRAARTGKGRES